MEKRSLKGQNVTQQKIKLMTSGGFRKNARRPLKYGEPTVNLTMRVPKSKKKYFKDLVNGELKKLIVKKLDK
jgi:hypothetical protein